MKSMTYTRPTQVDVYQIYAIIQTMFRIIILVAIFFAVYPMIGNGYDQFSNDWNLHSLGNSFSNIVEWFGEVIEKLQS